MNFWQQLPTPFFTVAPMADVTDAPFRRLIAKYSSYDRIPPHTKGGFILPLSQKVGGPDVMWTEFVSADGLLRATPEGKQKLLADLIYTEAERPIVAQLFSSTEAHMEAAAALCLELGFDGVDINMGCPDRSIEKQGCGAAMIKTPDIARAIIRAAKRGARHGEVGGIPVSVKTRVGYNHDAIDTWIPELLAEAPAALTVHARTRQELSQVPADWERIARVVALRDSLAPQTRVIGNGDVLSAADGHLKANLSGADGVMVGRALFGNPWFFHPTRRLPTRLTALPTHGVNRDTIITTDTSDTAVEYISLTDRLQVLLEHTELFVELLPFKNFAVMKKHYKAYVSGFPGAADLRGRLMEAPDVHAVRQIVTSYIETL